MYKVLLVEDIDLIRRDILEMIDWECHGYIVTGEAKNGEQGLELYKQYPADIIITDIKMPVMDGLEMIRQIQKLNQQVQFILLTAYEEFDYAKQAMSMGIHSYLLKHEIDQQILLVELEKSKAVILQQESYQCFNQSDILRRYLNGTHTPDISTSQLYPWSGETVLLLLESKKTDDMVGHMDFHALLHQLRTHPTKHKYVCYTLSDSLCLFLVKASSNGKMAPVNHAAEEFAAALHKADECLKFQHAISIGLVFSDLRSLKKAYLFARQQLDEQLFYSKSCILSPSSFHGIPQSARMQSDAQLSQLCELLNTAKFYQAQKIIQILLEEKQPLYKNIDFYIATTDQIIRQILELRHIDLPMDMIRTLTEINAAAKKTDIFTTSKRICHILEQIQQTLVPRYSRKIDEAIRYIQAHYYEDISLNSLSEHLGISPLYVSQLFKKEVGINLMTYITRYRIRVAEELLKSGNYKVYEVSEMVGYQTVQYFSNSFKKETGKKPSEYVQAHVPRRHP